jgi:CMP-N,N'-diacetyllegionaminic acid synthase
MTETRSKILGIVPARMGSKRVIGKNTRLLAGKPLCQYAIDAALGAKRLDRVIVSSDDEQVLDVARRAGEDLPLLRPAELAHDTSPAVDYVFHALAELEARGEGPYDAVCIIPSSSPFTLSKDVDATIELFLRSGAETAVSVVQLDHAVHPFKMKVMEGDRLLPYIEEERGRMAAHELPKIFVRNCSVYVSRRSVFFDYRQIVGSDMRGYVMPSERSMDINIEQDLLFAEFLMSRARAT